MAGRGMGSYSESNRMAPGSGCGRGEQAPLLAACPQGRQRERAGLGVAQAAGMPGSLQVLK